MQYKLQVSAYTPRGEFTGYFGVSSDNREEVEELSTDLRSRVNELLYITLESGDKKIILNQNILRESVLVFNVVEDFR